MKVPNFLLHFQFFIIILLLFLFGGKFQEAKIVCGRVEMAKPLQNDLPTS